MRISAEEALKRGLIDQKTAKTIEGGGKRSGLSMSKAVAKLNPALRDGLQLEATTATPVKTKKPRADLPSSGSKEYLESANSPQKILFDALCRRLPGLPIWEAQGLIPGREFRTDIFIPPKVVIEMDGYAFHRAKEAFQADRRKQNLYVAHGYLPIRAYAGQIFKADELNELVDLIIQTVNLP
jgi:very-short-patch-repair endonuclease